MATEMIPPPPFTLKGVSFRYQNGQTALHNIDLEIEQNEKIVLLGANGCGKSTLIKILNGLLFPSSGSLSAFGVPITETSLRNPSIAHEFRRRVGFVFQNAEAQLFSSTIEEELAFAPLQMGLDAISVRQRVEDVSRLLRLESLLHRTPYSLSGGEKRRVAIACILTINPDVILLDEPTSGLDPRSQNELVTLLESLHDAGKTLVTTTHDLTLLPRLATRVVIMNEDHEIEAICTPQKTLHEEQLLKKVNIIA